MARPALFFSSFFFLHSRVRSCLQCEEHVLPCSATLGRSVSSKRSEDDPSEDSVAAEVDRLQVEVIRTQLHFHYNVGLFFPALFLLILSLSSPLYPSRSTSRYLYLFSPRLSLAISILINFNLSLYLSRFPRSRFFTSLLVLSLFSTPRSIIRKFRRLWVRRTLLHLRIAELQLNLVRPFSVVLASLETDGLTFLLFFPTPHGKRCFSAEC